MKLIKESQQSTVKRRYGRRENNAVVISVVNAGLFPNKLRLRLNFCSEANLNELKRRITKTRLKAVGTKFCEMNYQNLRLNYSDNEIKANDFLDREGICNGK